MKILDKNSLFPTKVTLLLGFFDGVHTGHRKVILSGIEFAKKNASQTVLVTFKTSPAEYFNGSCEYIFERSHSYGIIQNLGVDYILEQDFAEITNMEAKNYLEYLVKCFSPKAIFTGFNNTFGKNKGGNPEFLRKFQDIYNYKYFCIEACRMNDRVVSSSLIKELLKQGDIEESSTVLASPFILKSKVIDGEKLGRKLGFPTANMTYPEKIVKIPHGVYKVKVLNKPAVLNWGIRPTVGGNKEIMELHIPNFNQDLYGQTLEIEIIKKIRDEKQFNNTDELREQIKKDIKECLE